MTSAQRIALNTIATYARSIFSAALGLFSMRWVLGALGQSDFGLFSVVGSIITFIVFLNGVMAGSAARHFAYSIGEGDTEKVNHWFNAALSIHMILPILLILIGWPIGEYCINNVLRIPPDRIATSLWVFRISLISAFFSMVTIPFSAMFTAKQHITTLAFWGTLQSILSFSFAFLLTRMSGDRLLLYAIGTVAITILMQVGLSAQAMIVFRECRIRRAQWFDVERFKKILSFAVWNFIGSFGAILRNQGSSILLNIFFGPKVNAAFGIANTVSSQAMTLSGAMTGAISPEITASEGRGDRKHMLDIALRMCKFSTLLVMLFAIPLVAEIDYVLKLWLHDVPQYAGTLCQLMLIMFLIDQLTVGYMSAVNAQGKIAAYQATLGSILVLTLPLAWLFLKAGFPPTGVGFAFVINIFFVSLGRVYWGRHLLGMPVQKWLNQVVLPCAIAGVISTVAAVVPLWWFSSSFTRFILVIAASVIATILAGWFIALNASERLFLARNATHMKERFGLKFVNPS
ncbi:MAG: MATE family efflux transporter [Chlorobiaceae bacterium]|jgi:O-antigen/teichoic acid export membrane protein|nr:MATE family efflux transporter [Chlorobiaceae bacterium]NTV17180.1 MATE family efflux transporter [Chlorobiaceae bacterium]